MTSRGRHIVVIGACCAMLWLTTAVFASSDPIIIDNDNTQNSLGSFSAIGSWYRGTSAERRWESDYLYTTAGGVLNTVEWRPDIPEAGLYEVAVYFPHGDNRAPDAPFQVNYVGGQETVKLDQRRDGEWVSLGTYPFDDGTAGYVSLSNDATSGVLIADAVRFLPVSDRGAQFRGLWVDAFGTGFRSTSEINSLVSRAVAGNYNAILPEVLAYQDAGTGGGGAFWKSSIVPWASPVSSSFDPLAYLCQQAHAQGIEVHPWLVTYRVSNSWPPNNNPTIAAHPEWIMVPQGNMGGGPAPVGDKYVLDPGSSEVQDYLVSIVQELVGNYEVDGIHFDYIRYTNRNAGYPSDSSCENSSLARYQRLSGITWTPAYTDSDWSDFRRQTIDELVRRCRAEIPSIDNPRQPLRLTAALLATGGAPADFSDSAAYSLHQNWKYWLEKGWLDAGCPMNYKDERNSSHASMFRSWIDAAVAWKGDRHVYCGQGNYLNSMANSIIQMQYIQNAGAEGVLNYSYRSTADEDGNGSSEANWSWYPYVASNLFTSPASLPEMPWRDPDQATEGTLWGRITDYETGRPIDGASVRVQGMSSIPTDGNGYYTITQIPMSGSSRECSVVVTGDHFVTESDTVTVGAGQVARLDFRIGYVPIPGDFDEDGDVDLEDYAVFTDCMNGPGSVPDPMSPVTVSQCLEAFDCDADGDVDLRDFADFRLYQEIGDVDDIILESRDGSGTILPTPAYAEDGSWNNSSAKSSADGLAGSGSRYITYTLPNSGSDEATFTPDVVQAGLYEVFVTWGNGANAYDVLYTVRDVNDENDILVDQISSGTTGANSNTWVSLGQFRFNAGTDTDLGSITVSESTVSGRPATGWNQRVYSDAVKLVFISP